jgi:hypothetical protein
MRVVALGVALIAGTSLFVPELAQAQAASWSVDGAGTHCTLSRPVGGTTPTTLIIRSAPTTEKYELMLVRQNRWKWPRSPFENVRITFKPSGAVHERLVEATDLGKGMGRGLGAQNLSPAFFQDFARSGELSIEAEKRELGTFSYPGAKKAAEAFDLCMIAKLIEWGADPAGFEAGARRPKPMGDPNDWLLGNDRRKSIGSRGAGDLSGVAKLNLDTQGRVEACELLEGTNDKFASLACSRLEAAARYEPARDKQGNSVKSVMLVSWDIRTAREVRVGSFQP